MAEGKHSHQMLLSAAMVDVASCGAHSEQVDEQKRVGGMQVVGVVEEEEGFVEERADWDDHPCHQDQHLTKETLVT